jgi:Flp pilus assembly protein TadD
MGRKKALIIAISEYDNDYPLKYCEKDGIEVSKLLSSSQLAYEIEKQNKLIGYVRSEKMRDTIVDFFNNKEVKPDDMLLFYYSGHGIPDESGKPYLSPSEIDPDLPIRRGFSFNEFGKVLKNSVSTKKVVILDCCFSGSAEIGKGKINDSIQLITSIKEDSEPLEQGEGICILAASQPYQGAYPLVEQGHSIFTYYMLEGLKDNEESVDSNGNVTPYSLNRYISKKINSLPAEKRPRQKPLMKSETSGEIILASYPKKPPPIMPIPNSPTKSSEAEVRKGILGSKSILIGVGIAAVVAVVLVLTSLNYYNHSSTNSPPTTQYALIDKRLALTDKGLSLDALGNHTGAIGYYDMALALDPNDVYALADKGNALNSLGNYTQAIQFYDKALARESSDQFLLYDKGDALNGLGNYTGAIIYLDKALSIDPKLKAALNDKGWALNGLGNYTGAIIYLDKALSIDPEYGAALATKGHALNGLGNYTGAIIYLDKALAINHNDVTALYNKGLALDGLGNHTGAKIYLDKALAIDPKDKYALCSGKTRFKTTLC